MNDIKLLREIKEKQFLKHFFWLKPYMFHTVEVDEFGIPDKWCLDPIHFKGSTVTIDEREIPFEYAKYYLEEKIVNETDLDKKINYQSMKDMMDIMMIQDELDKGNLNYFTGPSLPVIVKD